MADLKYGLFSVPGSLCEGDPYVKPKPKVQGVDTKYKGAQFKTNPPKKGKTLDTFFDKTIHPLHVGSEYLEQARLERQLANRYRRKGDVGNGKFLPSTPTKKGVGLGSYFGTFGAPYKYESPYNVPQKGEASPRSRNAGLRPIMTNPPRKGGPGTNVRTLGKDFEYTGDSQDGIVSQQRTERRKQKQKQLAGPFVSALSPRNEPFDHNTVYRDAQPHLPMIKPRKKQPAIRGMFTGPCKAGRTEGFSSYEYKPQPESDDRDRKRAEREREQQRRIGGVFRYSSPSKSMLYRKVKPPKDRQYASNMAYGGSQTARF